MRMGVSARQSTSHLERRNEGTLPGLTELHPGAQGEQGGAVLPPDVVPWRLAPARLDSVIAGGNQQINRGCAATDDLGHHSSRERCASQPRIYAGAQLGDGAPQENVDDLAIWRSSQHHRVYE